MKRRLQTLRALPALALAAALLAACAPAQPAATPAPTASAAPAATPAPTASPAATAEPSPTPEPGLDYDEMRSVAVHDAVPSTALEGYFTVSKDGKWGLIRADGTELLPCRADTPVSSCGQHWIWDVTGMSWAEIDELTARLDAGGEPAICGGHGGVQVRFVYDLDAPGRDVHAYDPGALRVYVEPDGPGTFQEITEEMWAAYGDPLPVSTVHEVQETGEDSLYPPSPSDPFYPSDPVVTEMDDGQIIYQYASRAGSLYSPRDVQLAGFFFDEALAPIRLTSGSWAYLGRDSQEPVTDAVYDATYDRTRDPDTGDFTAAPLYAAPLQNGYAAVRRGDTWGLLDSTGAEVIPCAEPGVAWEGTTLWVKDAGGWHRRELP